MKLYIIAGEDSGDLHAGNLIKALQKMQPDMEFRGVGGDHMAGQGMELVEHVNQINFMGFWEVIQNLGTIRKLFRTVKEDIKAWKPDAVVLTDYPGFNLRMAPFIYQLGIPVYYYISPQLWAWKKGRVKIIRKFIKRMFVILPFEQEFYQKEGIEVDFVGHPLLDAIENTDSKKDDNQIIALLPGSRKQEIKRMLPVMLELVKRFPEFQFIIGGAPSQSVEFYRQIMGSVKVELRMNQTYELLRQASYALVSSGTATLETALFNVPQVVCYKGSALSYFIGKRLVQVKFISLVNLILDKKAVEELIQYDFHADNLERELKALMKVDRQQALAKDYVQLHEILGDAGASARTASLLMEDLRHTETNLAS